MTGNVSQELGAADLHLHTRYSDGVVSVDELLDQALEHCHLNVIAVTDHDTIRGGFAARERAVQRGLPIEVVVGVEVNTLWGHLIALYVEDQIPSLRPLPNTIEAVHQLGGLCIVPHPFAFWVPSVGRRALRKLRGLGPGYCPIGVEAFSGFNAHLDDPDLRSFARVGGSDAHMAAQVGSRYTRFKGATAQDLRRSLLQGETVPARGKRPSIRDLSSSVAEITLRSLVATPSRVASQVLGTEWKPGQNP
jgi:hypothetical protein